MAVRPETVDKLREIVRSLPYGLAEHVFRVEDEAVRLARIFGVNEDRARVAALGHDLVRGESPDHLLELAAEWQIMPTELDFAEPILLHGPIAARMLARDYGVEDAEVLAAAAFHTTAHAAMEPVEKILFLADKFEEHKLARRPELAEVRNLAANDLDAAMRCFLDLYLSDAIERGWLLNPATIEARNELLAARAAKAG